MVVRREGKIWGGAAENEVEGGLVRFVPNKIIIANPGCPIVASARKYLRSVGVYELKADRGDVFINEFVANSVRATIANDSVNTRNGIYLLFGNGSDRLANTLKFDDTEMWCIFRQGQIEYHKMRQGVI